MQENYTFETCIENLRFSNFPLYPEAEPSGNSLIKMVEPVRITTDEERIESLQKAGNCTFLLKSHNVSIDLLTDSGTSTWAMKRTQPAGISITLNKRFVNTTGTNTWFQPTRAAPPNT